MRVARRRLEESRKDVASEKGGGFRSGMHGATDEFGHHAVEGIVNHYDYHATLLHLFGLDATQLTYEQNARDQSLLDGQPGKVIPELLA